VHPTAAAWFARRTSSWRDWPLERLVRCKNDTTVSVVLPALDEGPTVGEIVTGVRRLADHAGLVDEVVVIDSGSTDNTAKIAADAGAAVYHVDDILPGYGSRPGKGEALWKALAVTTGDVIVYIDADLTDFRSYFVTGLLGPLFTDAEVAMVKAYYDRPLLDVAAGGGGRVTELMARPLINAYFPELAGVVQPLAGEYAARRSLLESLPFAAGYGVETGLLLDTVLDAGLDAVAQVDLGQRTHGHQDTAALGRMAATILHTVLERVHPGDPRSPALTQFARHGGAVTAVDHDVTGEARPPMVSIPEYKAGSPC
jgi:glucosyl-3-phosphoglycerate synthase